MTPKLKQEVEAAAKLERIYEPKYGGKDHSGYETMMKYEVNDEREECYEKGAQFMYYYLLKNGPELELPLQEISKIVNDSFPMSFHTNEKSTATYIAKHISSYQHQKDASFISARDEKIVALQNKLEIAVTEINRLVSANYHSLLEATAYMGIPQSKRENFIEQHISNTKFIADKALKEIEGVK